MVLVMMTSNAWTETSTQDTRSWTTDYCPEGDECTRLDVTLNTRLSQLDLRIPELDRCVGRHSVTISQTDIPEECRTIVRRVPQRPGFAEDVRGWVRERTGLKISERGVHVPGNDNVTLEPNGLGVRIRVRF